MICQIKVEIAGITTRLVLDDSLAKQIGAAFHLFCSDKETEYCLHVNIVPTLSQNIKGETKSFIKNGHLTVLSEEFVGGMDLRAKKGEMNILPRWPLGSLAAFLRNLYSALIISEGGLMLHAAGVVKDGCAYIFFGPSGSGKSTVTKLSNPYKILTDELVAIRRLGGTFKAYGTPYWGDNVGGINGAFRIGGLFKLVQSKNVYLKELSQSQATTELLTVPYQYDTITSMEKILSTVSELTKLCPCCELHFLPDNSFWRCIDEHINAVPASVG